MVRVSRILKDFRETGALNSLIALWGFVDDTTFLTKAGAVGVLYRLQGVDFECLDHPQRQAIVHGFEQALRQLDESFRVYQYLIKRPAPVVTVRTDRCSRIAAAGDETNELTRFDQEGCVTAPS